MGPRDMAGPNVAKRRLNSKPEARNSKQIQMTKTKTNDSRRQAVFVWDFEFWIAFVWHFENLNFDIDIVSDFKCRDFEFRIYYTLILATFGAGQFFPPSWIILGRHFKKNGGFTEGDLIQVLTEVYNKSNR